MLFLSFNLKHLHRVAVQFRARTRVSRPNDFIDVMVATELQQFVRAYEFMLMRLLLLLLLLLLLPATWTSSPPSRQKKRLRKIRSLLAASFLSEATTELSFHRHEQRLVLHKSHLRGVYTRNSRLQIHVILLFGGKMIL